MTLHVLHVLLNRLEGMALKDVTRMRASLTFAPSTAENLHLAGTANCVDCCRLPHSKPWYSAFQIQAPVRHTTHMHTHAHACTQTRRRRAAVCLRRALWMQLVIDGFVALDWA